MWKACIIVVPFIALLVGANYLHTEYVRQTGIGTLTSPGLSPIEKLNKTKGSQDEELLELRTKTLKDALSAIELDFKSAESESDLDSILSSLQSLRDTEPGVYLSRIDELIQAANDNKQSILLQLVQDSFDQKKWNDFEEYANRFLREYPTSSRADKVREFGDKHRSEERSNARARIRRASVTDSSSLQGKSQRIFEFLERYGDDLSEVERKQMKRAADLGKQFSEKQNYSVTLKRSGNFLKPQKQAVLLSVSDITVNTYNSDTSSTSVTWPHNNLKFQWQSGEPIEVALKAYYYWFSRTRSDVARMSDKSPIALRLLGGKQDLTQIDDDWKAHCKEAFVTFEVDGITEHDWKAVADYLTPGEAW